MPKEKKNSEGYSDLTAYAVMKNIDRACKLRQAIINMCKVTGFYIRGPIVLVDKKTGKVWR